MLITVVLLPWATYTGTQEYRDIIYGLASYNTNKTGELNLFRGMLSLNCVVIIVIGKYQRSLKCEEYEATEKNYGIYLVLILNIGCFLRTLK